MAKIRNRCNCCFAPKAEPGICPKCGCDENAQNASHQLQIGVVLQEQYLIGKVLGQGGFGITYLGWDLYLDIPVAIKEYYPSGTVMREATVTMDVADVTGDDGARFRNNRDRFMREAKMLGRFSLVPEIVQIKNFFQANNTAYIVMEYVEGITLKQHVKNSGGKLSVEETFRLLGPVIETLSKVHKTGIVHRDISPDNIMMLPDGGCKLLDFGAVRDVTGAEVGKELTKSTEAILKQGYAPIEQYQKKGSLGPWTDVYALCATIYYCLTGEVPPDAPARVLAYEEMDLEATGLNQNQQAALLHGMALRVEDRARSMEELHQELFGEKDAPEIPVPLAPVKPQRDPVKPEIVSAPAPKPKGKLFAAIAAALVVVVIAAVALLGGGADDAVIETEPTQTEAVVEIASGTSGALSWMLDSLGELRIAGNGEIPDGEAPWSGHSDQIRSIVLEGNITRIGDEAFARCSNLESVDFGNGLQTIGCGAFREAGFGTLTLPDTLLQILDSAFEGSCLTEIVIPDSVEFIGNWAFARCDALASVTIGPNTRLCYDELNNAWSLPIFCNSEGTFGNLVLKGCSGGIVEDYAAIVGCPFEAIGKAEPEARGTVDGNVTWWFDRETGFLKLSGEGWLGFYGGSFLHMGSNAYANSKVVPWDSFREEIRTVSIGDGIQGGIPCNLFENHVNLDDVYFGKCITNIDQYAFANTAIDWLHMPDNITGISEFAFDHCSRLRHVVVSMGVHGLYKSTFNQCLNLEELYIGGWMENGNQRRYNPFVSLVKGEMDMPQNLTIYTAGEYSNAKAFAEDYGIPWAQGIDGRQAELMGVAGEQVYWSLEDGVLTLFGVGGTDFFDANAGVSSVWNDGVHYGFTGEHPSFYPYRNEIEHIVIEPGVTHLNKSLFADLSNLKSIDFGQVTHISENAIENCGMEALVFPQSVVNIRDKAIMNCPNLRRIEIQNGSEYLGHILKSNLPALEEVALLGDPRIQSVFDKMLTNYGAAEVMLYVREGTTAQAFAESNGMSYEIVQ